MSLEDHLAIGPEARLTDGLVCCSMTHIRPIKCVPWRLVAGGSGRVAVQGDSSAQAVAWFPSSAHSSSPIVLSL